VGQLGPSFKVFSFSSRNLTPGVEKRSTEAAGGVVDFALRPDPGRDSKRGGSALFAREFTSGRLTPTFGVGRCLGVKGGPIGEIAARVRMKWLTIASRW
jgi:hypothetical protein